MRIIKQNYSKRGISIYLALMIIAILLSSAFGVSIIFVSQVKIFKEMGNSVVAFYAADAGMEKILLNRQSPSDIPETALANGATYQVLVTAGGGGGCAAANFCIKSVGNYKETNRAIEISY